MAVAYDNAGNHGAAAATSNQVTLTIGSGANRAILCVLLNPTGTSLTVSGGGVSNWALISGTTGNHIMIWGGTAPTSGSQTITASWTGSNECNMGVITFSGVDQTTPFANGAHAATTNVTITAVSDDMTVGSGALYGVNLTGPTQTLIFTDNAGHPDYTFGSTYAAATGNMNHAWTNAEEVNGVAVKQASGSVTVAQYQNALDAQRNAPGIVGINHWWT